MQTSSKRSGAKGLPRGDCGGGGPAGSGGGPGRGADPPGDGGGAAMGGDVVSVSDDDGSGSVPGDLFVTGFDMFRQKLDGTPFTAGSYESFTQLAADSVFSVVPYRLTMEEHVQLISRLMKGIDRNEMRKLMGAGRWFLRMENIDTLPHPKMLADVWVDWFIQNFVSACGFNGRAKTVGEDLDMKPKSAPLNPFRISCSNQSNMSNFRVLDTTFGAFLIEVGRMTGEHLNSGWDGILKKAKKYLGDDFGVRDDKGRVLGLEPVLFVHIDGAHFVFVEVIPLGVNKGIYYRCSQNAPFDLSLVCGIDRLYCQFGNLTPDSIRIERIKCPLQRGFQCPERSIMELCTHALQMPAMHSGIKTVRDNKVGKLRASSEEMDTYELAMNRRACIVRTFLVLCVFRTYEMMSPPLYHGLRDRIRSFLMDNGYDSRNIRPCPCLPLDDEVNRSPVSSNLRQTRIKMCTRVPPGDTDPESGLFGSYLDGRKIGKKHATLMSFVRASLSTVFPDNVPVSVRKEIADEMLRQLISSSLLGTECVCDPDKLKTLKHGEYVDSVMLYWFVCQFLDVCGMEYRFQEPMFSGAFPRTPVQCPFELGGLLDTITVGPSFLRDLKQYGERFTEHDMHHQFGVEFRRGKKNTLLGLLFGSGHTRLFGVQRELKKAVWRDSLLWDVNRGGCFAKNVAEALKSFSLIDKIGYLDWLQVVVPKQTNCECAIRTLWAYVTTQINLTFGCDQLGVVLDTLDHTDELRNSVSELTDELRTLMICAVCRFNSVHVSEGKAGPAFPNFVLTLNGLLHDHGYGIVTAINQDNTGDGFEEFVAGYEYDKWDRPVDYDKWTDEAKFYGSRVALEGKTLESFISDSKKAEEEETRKLIRLARDREEEDFLAQVATEEKEQNESMERLIRLMDAFEAAGQPMRSGARDDLFGDDDNRKLLAEGIRERNINELGRLCGLDKLRMGQSDRPDWNLLRYRLPDKVDSFLMCVERSIEQGTGDKKKQERFLYATASSFTSKTWT